MRTGRILHPELARLLATLGHTDLILVTDAGFPIPTSVPRVDLALARGLPTVPQVLRVLREEVFVEEVTFAPEVQTHNPRLYDELQDIYTGSGATFSSAAHEELIENHAPQAKVVVRTGDFNPWANIALTASTDPFAWFDDDAVAAGMRILPAYAERRQRMSAHEVPSLP